MRKVAGENLFCVLIFKNSYIFHICFILFILLSYLIFYFVCLTLSSADTHGIAKYARTYIRDTHTHANTQKKKKDKVERLEKEKKRKVEKKKTCTAPPSCSLQHLLKLSLLSLRPSLLQFVSIVSPHSPFLRFGLPAPQPSRRYHAQSLLGPSFHDPGTHHVLESHPEQAVPLSRRDDERCHAIVSHSVLALRLHLAACSPSSSCRF